MASSFVAIIATFGRYVLLGRSGRSVADGLQGGDLQTILDAQRYPAAADTPAARAIAHEVFADYAEANNYNVGLVSWKPADAHGPARYSTRYLHRTNPNPPGFIKGTVTPATANPNVLRQTAIEEFKEEVGLTLTNADLIPTAKPNVFVVDLATKVAQKQDVINLWKERRPFTELVDLRWVLRNSIPTLNYQSESVRGMIPDSVGGRRRTYRRGVRSKSKRQKMGSK